MFDEGDFGKGSCSASLGELLFVVGEFRVAMESVKVYISHIRNGGNKLIEVEISVEG